jgi:hypothetical protein
MSIETFNNKWGDHDFGGGLTESLKEDTARMFRLNQMSKLEFVYKMNATPFFRFSKALNASFF